MDDALKASRSAYRALALLADFATWLCPLLAFAYLILLSPAAFALALVALPVVNQWWRDDDLSEGAIFNWLLWPTALFAFLMLTLPKLRAELAEGWLSLFPHGLLPILPAGQVQATLEAFAIHMRWVWLAGVLLAPAYVVAMVALWRMWKWSDDRPERKQKRLRGRREEAERQKLEDDRRRDQGRRQLETSSAFARRLRGRIRSLSVSSGYVTLTLRDFVHQLLVVGITGSGKTESMLRMVWLALIQPERPAVFFLDGKASRDDQERFLRLATDRGRSCLCFPQERFGGFSGEREQIIERLMAVVPTPDEGPASYYTQGTEAVLHYAVGAPAYEKPHSGQDLLMRLNRPWLERAWRGHDDALADIAQLDDELVKGTWLRFRAFFAAVGDLLDGEADWESFDSGYFLIDVMAKPRAAQALGRFLSVHFQQWVSDPNRRHRHAVFFFDEFSAFEDPTSILTMVKMARSKGVGIVLASQTVEALAQDEAIRAELIQTVGLRLLHRSPDPEQIAQHAGTKAVYERSVYVDEGRKTATGSARLQDRFVVDPNQARRLEAGEGFLIGSGEALKVRVLLAPTDYTQPVSVPHSGRSAVAGDPVEIAPSTAQAQPAPEPEPPEVETSTLATALSNEPKPKPKPERRQVLTDEQLQADLKRIERL